MATGRDRRRLGFAGSIMGGTAAVLLALAAAGPARAGDDPPLDEMVIAVAEHFVQEKYMFGGLGHYHIEFDVAYLHPQPQPDFWAVVGGFVTDQNTFNTYVAAVRLICPESKKVECWRLEKLAINDKILLNENPPL